MKEKMKPNKTLIRRTVRFAVIPVMLLLGSIGARTTDVYATEQITVNDMVYELQEDETAKLVSVGEMKDVIIPESVPYEGKEYPVTQLEEYLCFGNNTMETLTLPDTIRELPKDAFSQCRALKEIVFPQHLERIEARCFYLCYSLTSLTLPDSVREVKEAAFNLCTGLEIITLSQSLKEIGPKAFHGCYQITTIEIPAQVEQIGVNAFRYCFQLQEYVVQNGSVHFAAENGVLFNYDKTELVSYPVGKLDAVYQVPDGVVRISDISKGFAETIESNEILKKIYFPDSLTEIGDSVSFGPGGVVLYGKENSYIQQYAKAHGYEFQSIESRIITHVPSNSFSSMDNNNQEETEQENNIKAESQSPSKEIKPSGPKKFVVRKGKKNRKRINITNKAKNSSVTYQIKDKKIAVVSRKGTVRGKRKGRTKLVINITQNNKRYRLVVTIIVK